MKSSRALDDTVTGNSPLSDIPAGARPYVAVRRDGLVAVAVEASPKTGPGTVQFYDVDGKPLGSVGVGALPDMLTFAERGKLLVANEGEASDDGSVDD